MHDLPVCLGTRVEMGLEKRLTLVCLSILFHDSGS